MLEPLAEILEQTPSAPGVTCRIGLVHRAADRNPQTFGQRINDIAFLVLAATLNQRVRAEHFDHRLVQRFGPVDND